MDSGRGYIHTHFRGEEGGGLSSPVVYLVPAPTGMALGSGDLTPPRGGLLMGWTYHSSGNWLM